MLHLTPGIAAQSATSLGGSLHAPDPASVAAADATADPTGAASPLAGSGGDFPKKQLQNDEAQAPLDDQERRAVQRRMQRRAEERAAEVAAGRVDGTKSAREPSRTQAYTSGAYTPKGSWIDRAAGQLTGRLTGRRTGTARAGGGYLSSRSAISTARSYLSTSRSMMTTARSDVATGRYNDVLDNRPEATEFRPIKTIDISAANKLQGTVITSETAATAPRRKTAASTAANLRAGLLRRGVALTGRKSNNTGRTPRTSRAKGERPHWA